MEKAECSTSKINYRTYSKEEDLQGLMQLVDRELSEPYTIFTYRYFIYNWPNLCFLAFTETEGKEECVGALVCKMEPHKQVSESVHNICVEYLFHRVDFKLR